MNMIHNSDAEEKKSCKGELALNVEQNFYLTTPSFSISKDGISLGVLELRSAENKGAKLWAAFRCTKCQEIITMKQAEDHILVKCDVCMGYHPPSEMNYSRQIPNVCNTCLEYMKGEKENPPAVVVRVMQYIDVSSPSVKFTPLADILKKPVSA